MGTGRKYAKAPKTRPKKTGAARRRREKVQRRRLTALGFNEETLRHWTSLKVRQTLGSKPKKIAQLVRLASKSLQ